MDDYFKDCVIYRIIRFHAGLFQGGCTLFITQKVCTFRIFHLHCSIIRGIIWCEYRGDNFNGWLFQGGWILFDYIENIHLEYFSRELFQGSNVGWINLFSWRNDFVWVHMRLFQWMIISRRMDIFWFRRNDTLLGYFNGVLFQGVMGNWSLCDGYYLVTMENYLKE